MPFLKSYLYLYSNRRRLILIIINTAIANLSQFKVIRKSCKEQKFFLYLISNTLTNCCLTFSFLLQRSLAG